MNRRKARPDTPYPGYRNAFVRMPDLEDQFMAPFREEDSAWLWLCFGLAIAFGVGSALLHTLGG